MGLTSGERKASGVVDEGDIYGLRCEGEGRG